MKITVAALFWKQWADVILHPWVSKMRRGNIVIIVQMLDVAKSVTAIMTFLVTILDIIYQTHKVFPVCNDTIHQNSEWNWNGPDEFSNNTEEPSDRNLNLFFSLHTGCITHSDWKCCHKRGLSRKWKSEDLKEKEKEEMAQLKENVLTLNQVSVVCWHACSFESKLSSTCEYSGVKMRRQQKLLKSDSEQWHRWQAFVLHTMKLGRPIYQYYLIILMWDYMYIWG